MDKNGAHKYNACFKCPFLMNLLLPPTVRTGVATRVPHPPQAAADGGGDRQQLHQLGHVDVPDDAGVCPGLERLQPGEPLHLQRQQWGQHLLHPGPRVPHGQEEQCGSIWGTSPRRWSLALVQLHCFQVQLCRVIVSHQANVQLIQKAQV